MKKRRYRGLNGLEKITAEKTNKTLKKMGGVALGLAVATALNTFLQKKTNLNGDTLVGLDGTTSKFVVPAGIGALGVIGSQLVKGEFAKDVAVGVAAAGAAGLVNKLTEKAIVSLSGDEMIPGLGDATPQYEQLPTYTGQPQEGYMIADHAVENTEDIEPSLAPESGETINGVDDDNFFIA